jgi:GT2 family glycosyltransferase
VSVVIPTHNPRSDYLARVIESLRHQTLPHEQWELLVVDNASREKVEGRVDIGWQPNARVVREGRLGLTFARLRGFAEAKGQLIVMVDDDNVLASEYLETAVRIAEERPMLGAFGGKCLPEFEHEPEEWLASVTSGLGLRDRGARVEVFTEAAVAGSWQLAVGSWQGGENGKPPTDHRQRCAVREFPDCAPIGAGMVLRRDAAAAYAKRLQARGARQGARGKETITDRIGDSLASGGDNDICLTVLEEGWQVGYLPQLELTHLIPKRRMTLDYQKRMAREAMRSFILMLDQHGIRPWGAIPRWSVPLRVAKDYLRVQPWRSPELLLKWSMNRGRYEACGGLAAKRP